MKVVKGQILAITQGEYSDYCLKDHVRALKDFDTDEIKDFFKSQTKPRNDWSNDYDQDTYIAWCIEHELIEPLTNNEVLEWFIGTYGDIE